MAFLGFLQISKAIFFSLAIEKITRIAPANIILQVTSHAGSTCFSSNKYWAQVPEIPQNMAEEMAMIKPGTF
jgi:hypothetical protein